MDQGNTDPNNPNPTAPQPMAADAPTPPVDQFMPAPAIPAAPLSTAPAIGEPSWSNPIPPVADTAAQPTAFNPFSTPAPEPIPTVSTGGGTEAVPTDLSNLAGNSFEATNYVPQAESPVNMGTTTPESLVVGPATSTEPAQAVTATGGGGFPKIIYVVGGLVLLIVIAASAYFIFGVGKSTEPAPTSVPAVQEPVTSPPPPIIPSSSPSASLPGSTSTSAATPAGAGSAFNLLRQRAATAPANP